MKRFHLFYFTTLLLVWGWYGNHWWQWQQVESVTTTPEATVMAQDLQCQHLLYSIKSTAFNYPSPQAISYAQTAEQFDTFFQKESIGTQFLRDSVLSWLAKEDKGTYRYLKEIEAYTQQGFSKVKGYMAIRTLYNFIAIKTGCTYEWIYDPLVSTNYPYSLRVGETYLTDFGLRPGLNNAYHSIELAGRLFPASHLWIDTVFTTPGYHALNLKVKTQFCYWGFDERVTRYIHVVNPSK